ncbi:carnosine N-methyltransferase [Cimex lectularius]|uniref:carnosine N-methyltransferase n=1 Tax=Cimex lectularius TaxID=79782 RepID=A0A8I6R7K0_CIMLE|nr:carnosine N-methyltransferase [Cimex lectularius]
MDKELDEKSLQEREHFFKIIQSFKAYKNFSRSIVNKRLAYLNTLPQVQQVALKKYRNKLEQLVKCIDQNSRIIRLIIQDIEKLFENVQHDWEQNPPSRPKLTVADVDKVQITLKQFYRDWSKDGSEERLLCYEPIVAAIEERFPADTCRREDIHVLVPGAGLGRLAFEIARRGFTCQGNEFSLFMLFASNFILNRSGGVEIYELYPWVHQCDNNMSAEDQVAPIRFPDVDPSELYKMYGTSRFSMVAGDFLEVYNSDEQWDCVATCFFIDCANNIYTFIEKIYNVLKPGGVWINLGPLQYHYSTSLNEDSIEPSFEVVTEIIKSLGFVIEVEKTGMRTLYSQNPKSMLKRVYDSVFLICSKS